MSNPWTKGIATALLAFGLCLCGVAHAADTPEDIFWKSVKKTDVAEEYRLYIEQYPKGKYLVEARQRIGQLEAQIENKRRRDEADALRPGQIFKDCPDCPEMVVIPAGSFEMGSNSGNIDEQPVHRVMIGKALAIGKTEVTQGQWRAIMGSNPSQFTACGDICPVEKVSWSDAQDYVRRLSQKTGQTYRLPSEAEWEYACRAGGTHTYCGSNNVESVGWCARNSSSNTHAVTVKQANAWGLYDMSGNVWEWTQDCWNASYSGAPVDGSSWTSGDCSVRVVRGGSWFDVPRNLQSALRLRSTTDGRNDLLGFRLAKTLF
jgi:formylglycine-generating enzyme required for sulfatase activity